MFFSSSAVLARKYWPLVMSATPLSDSSSSWARARQRTAVPRSAGLERAAADLQRVAATPKPAFSKSSHSETRRIP